MSEKFKYEVMLKDGGELRRYKSVSTDDGWLKCQNPADHDSEEGAVTVHWFPSDQVEQVAFERTLPNVGSDETGVGRLG